MNEDECHPVSGGIHLVTIRQVSIVLVASYYNIATLKQKMREQGRQKRKKSQRNRDRDLIKVTLNPNLPMNFIGTWANKFLLNLRTNLIIFRYFVHVLHGNR